MNCETSSAYPASPNPLVRGMLRVEEYVYTLKSKVRMFYLRVMLSQYQCPACGSELRMDGVSRSVCVNGHVVDPTTTFQRSGCCGTHLIKRAYHYACSTCGKITPSRFLFDERVFDAEYFREMMRQSREKKKRRLAELRQSLAQSRSAPIALSELPEMRDIPGLSDALDAFAGSTNLADRREFGTWDEFDMETYRQAILEILENASVRFSAVPRLADNMRRDRARRFITLVFMEHERQVDLTQYGNDLLVEKHEADVEG